LPTSVAYDDLKKVRFPGDARQPGASRYTRVLRDKEFVHIPVYPGSILDNLGRLSLELSEEFCAAWDETQAAWFVLTSESIMPKVLNGRYDTASSDHLTYGTITLKVEPWVSADTVAKFYQRLQQDVLMRKGRASELRNLTVLRFVIGEIKSFFADAGGLDATKHRPTPWPELMKRWNAACSFRPSWTYRHPSKFKRDYFRAGRAVVEPYDHYEVDPLYRWSVP
jgi:hypothetical protein